MPNRGRERLRSAITSIGKNIRRSPHDGGFMPDLIIGVSRGGIIIADLLSRYLGGHIPVQCLWADRYKKYPHTVISPPHNIVNKHFKNLLSINGFKNILIVDDISRPGDNGSTISLAREFIQNMNLELTIKTLVLTIHDNAQEIPDYFAFKHNNTKYKMPFSVLG